MLDECRVFYQTPGYHVFLGMLCYATCKRYTHTLSRRSLEMPVNRIWNWVCGTVVSEPLLRYSRPDGLLFICNFSQTCSKSPAEMRRPLPRDAQPESAKGRPPWALNTSLAGMRAQEPEELDDAAAELQCVRCVHP